MGRKAAYTDVDFFQAADAMRAEGMEVTVPDLQQRLGGGYTRAYKLLEVWKQKYPQESDLPSSIEVPAGIQGQFQLMYRSMRGELNKEIIALREQAAKEVEASEDKLKQTLEEFEKLEAKNEADEQTIESLRSQVEGLQTKFTAATATLEQLNARIQAQDDELTKVRADAAAERKQQENAMATLQQQQEAAAATLNKALTAAQDALAKAQQSAAEQEAQLQALRPKIEEYKNSAAQADFARDDAVYKQKEAEQQAAAAEKQLERARNEQILIIKEGSEARGQLTALKEQNAELMRLLADRKSDDDKKKSGK